jgi:acetyl esterase/lipase
MPEDRSVLERPAPAPDAVIAYSDGPEQIADVRYGNGNASERPLLIVLHGGYWRPAYDRVHTGPMTEALAAHGWTVAAPEYRRIPGNPDAMLEDIRRAVTTLPEAIERHDGRFIAIGHSAGGHLALWAAATLALPRLLGVLALAPVADLALAHRLALGDGAVEAFLGSAPERRPDIDPRLLDSPAVDIEIVHGVQDEVVPLEISESYIVRQHGRTRLTSVDDCGHFQLIDPLSAAWPDVLDAVRRLSGNDA